MEDKKSNSQEIDEEINEELDKSEENSHSSNSRHSKVNGDQENLVEKENDEEKSVTDKNEEIENKSEHDEQNEIYKKTLNRAQSKELSIKSDKPSKPNSPLQSNSFIVETKKKKKNSNNQIHQDFFLSSVNDMKYIGEQFKVGKIDTRIKSPFEQRFEKTYAKTLKKLRENSPSQKKRLSREGKIILDPQYTLVNQLKYSGKQFICGKPDPRSKSPFEERFQKKFQSRLNILLPKPDRMPVAYSFEELKRMHNKLCVRNNIKA